MIAVFCESGGHILLGKAREIADESGDRVLAIALDDSREWTKSPDQLIALGADVVVLCRLAKDGWTETISDIIRSEPSLKLVIFPADLGSSVLMGSLVGALPEGISGFLEDVDSLTSDEAAKKIDDGFMIAAKLVAESSAKTSLVSVKINSVAEPFEDASRFGKTRVMGETASDVISDKPALPRSASSTLVVLVGRGAVGETSKLAASLAEKYAGSASEISGKIEVIYGPCIAIEVSSGLRELPDFKGELISISSKKFPIGSMAELSAVTPEVDKLLERLLSS